MKKLFSALATLVVLALAAPATAQTYTLNSTLTGPGEVTGTAVLVMDNSTLAPYTTLLNVAANSGAGPPSVPAEVVSATLTLNNLGGAPAATTFHRSDLSGFYFVRDGVGKVIELTFDAANSDGYALRATSGREFRLTQGPVDVPVTSGGFSNGPAPAPAAVPTLSEWAMILLGVMLAGGAALTIQRRRTA